ncbi:nucleotidyltransferase [Oerskovia sp. NPDC060287]|uniref:nucleotidyltransferase domain-containing protein n=1 Tax=Oerskovia sp. NPDC060287 TaxID=3347095 RepID=UPI00365669EF
MTPITTAGPRFDLDRMLRSGLAELDITEAEHELVVRRYSELGEVLDELWSSTRGDNKVFSQGSFRLGTVVRNVHRNDDIDIDIVAMRDIGMASITQESLKAEVGDAVRRYSRRVISGGPTVEESSRCWTLTWPGMHMDVLPAVPATDGGPHGLRITDRTVRHWLPSNPVGYANWFHARAAAGLTASGALEEKRLEIEAVPEWDYRSALQRAVQALKRHRDVYFGGRSHQRPSSIVLTTLAAHAYTGGNDLYDVVRRLVPEMGEHLLYVDDSWVLSNPAQPDENFVDSWAEEPNRSGHFFEWLRAAAADFAGLETKSGLNETLPALGAAFGQRFERGASRGLAAQIGSARAKGELLLTAGGLSIANSTPHIQPTVVRDHGFAGGAR